MQGTKEHNDHHEVGATGGEGFMLPFGWDPPQSREWHIGDDENQDDGNTHHPAVEDD